MQPKRVFHFSVDDKGNFTYTPPSMWTYHRPEVVRFETTSGNFTINFIPLTMGPGDDWAPLRGPLDSKSETGGLFAVETTVHDDLEEATREAIRRSNISPGEPDGFMGRYTYAIAMRDELGRIGFSDDSQNGTYKC